MLREKSADRAVTDHTHAQPEEDHSSISRDHHPTTSFSTISNYIEALWQFSGADQPDIGLRIDQFRGIQWIDEDHLFRNMFHCHDASQPIELGAISGDDLTRHVLRIETVIRETVRTPVGGNGSAGGELPPIADSPREIVLTYTDSTDRYVSRGWFVSRMAGPGVVENDFETLREPVPGRPTGVYFSPSRRSAPPEDANRLGRIQVKGSERMVVDALRSFEPRLTRLVTISINGLPVIHADLGLGRLMPMELLGDGMNRVLSITLAFETASGGMLLIDEIENGIHHSKLRDLWRAVSNFWRDLMSRCLPPPTTPSASGPHMMPSRTATTSASSDSITSTVQPSRSPSVATRWLLPSKQTSKSG